ncbi:MAG TPA: ATP-binding protein [Gaiellaceae bacterium]|jgi:signal transduction histidine kinase|nr:ATP-binding protein [Gaiellaceae bacterium]
MEGERERPVGAEALGRELSLLRDRLRSGEATREEAADALDALGLLAETLRVVEVGMLRRHEEREALLRTVLEQLPAGLVIARAPGGEIEASSAYGERLLGAVQPGDTAAIYPHVPIYAPGGHEPLPPEELPLSRALASGAFVGETRLELGQGPDARKLSAAAAPVVGDDGAMIAAVIVFADVTDQERREAAERDFVTNAAHELRTPLAAIAGAIEVLQAGAKELPRERDLFLSHIERESSRLGRLAHALLMLARAQTGTERPKLEIVPLRPLLRSVAQAIRPAPGVRLSVRCGTAVAALSNGELLEQAVVNLAGNAARYTRAGEISIRASSRAHETVVEVRDTGPGLSRAAQALAFDRFYRDRPAHEADGFGLGLAIARQAVDALGGTIELESEEGRGTTARLRLPVARLVQA